MTATVTLQLPDPIYQRLVNTAIATGRSLEEVMLHALKVGSPPDWENAPDEFKADLAALDRLEDEALWKVATGRKTEEEMARHFELLERNKEHTLTPAEQVELVELRSQADLFMLRKAHAAALLRWRGHRVPHL
ncbi:hypothetical protein H6G00_30340 [Leptolyngbya sp. FACHB-541]|uniref:hypothetical protein n=1 Tax=Leptolyngbya sp. FACHB-541 TaxID=2692810 RepID=UPI00168602E4|nr:hypothetical protein [Leptolyngbya sp. FACHB-541]MBD2000853.1 hypothetical protein [Leptolyngbya sp. FACHB-541]